MAREFTKLGYMIGVGGVVTYKNGRVLKEVVKNTDLSYILLETDAPYLCPEPYRGMKNDSSYIPEIAKVIAELKDILARAMGGRVAEKLIFGKKVKI